MSTMWSKAIVNAELVVAGRQIAQNSTGQTSAMKFLSGNAGWRTNVFASRCQEDSAFRRRLTQDMFYAPQLKRSLHTVSANDKPPADLGFLMLNIKRLIKS